MRNGVVSRTTLRMYVRIHCTKRLTALERSVKSLERQVASLERQVERLSAPE